MDKKKKTILLICAVIFIGSDLVRNFVTAYMRTIAERHHPPPPPPPPPSPVDPLAAEAAFGNFSGFWRGHAFLGSRGMCNLGLELRQNPPGHYAAYSRFACPHRHCRKGSHSLPRRQNRRSDTCPMTDLTITPFGTGAVIAEWRDCQDGKLLLQREAR